MSAYLKYFALERSPFAESGSSKIVLGTKALREAFATIRSGLDDGVSRICVSGGPGLGKTSLARALPKLLSEQARVALVLDPSVPWDALRGGLARQWGLERSGLGRASLIEASSERALVLVVDRAERATVDFLDHLDVVLSVRHREGRPAVQSVLLANLQHAEGHEPPALLWWLDRIHTLQLEFAPLSRDAVAAYIEKHLARAGRPGEAIFTREASHAIYERTGGVPGEIGRLCETLLGEAARRDVPVIDADLVEAFWDGGEGRHDGDPNADREMQERGTRGEAPRIAPPSDGTAHTAEPNAAKPDAPEPDAATVAGGHPGRTNATVLAPDSASEAGSGIDGEALEAYLSRPPTPEELRALRGGGLRSYAMTVLAIAAALTLAAVSLGLWLGDDAPSPAADAASATNGSASSAEATGEAGEEGAATPAQSPVLARLRGPVVMAESDEVESERTEATRRTRGGRETTQESPAAPKDASVGGEE